MGRRLDALADRIRDRRAARFLANGTAWGHIAFEEALKSSGMTADEIKDDRIGLIVGEGGPSTQVILQAAATTVEKGAPKRIGPFAVPKAMASGPSAVLSTWFQMRGINYSISSACALARARVRPSSFLGSRAAASARSASLSAGATTKSPMPNAG